MINDRYGVSGPEEGDEYDTSVHVTDEQAKNWELFEVRGGTVAQNELAARKIAAALNKHGLEILLP